MRLYDPTCPAWCMHDHPRYLTEYEPDNVIIHEYEFPGMPSLQNGRVEVTLAQMEVYADSGPFFPYPPELRINIPDLDCSPESAESVADTLMWCAAQARAMIKDSELTAQPSTKGAER